MAFKEALASRPCESWLQFEDPRGAVFHALNALGTSDSVTDVMERWITRLDTPTWLLDAVLFDIVRAARAESPIREVWVDRALQAAVVTEDVSLVESLVYTLGEATREHVSLVGLAEQLATSQPRVAKALRHVGVR
jgi:hypothetical protein